MLYEFFISLRFLASKKRQKFVSVTAAISIIGVIIGVMALNVVLAVMSGFEDELRNKILGVNSHIAVMSYDGAIKDYYEIVSKLQQMPEVAGAGPLIYNQAMLAAEGNVSGVVIKGVDPFLAGNVTSVEEAVGRALIWNGENNRTGNNMRLMGRDILLGLDDETASQKPPIILGKELAAVLGVIPGDLVNMLSPFGNVGPFGAMPKVKRFEVIGLFDFGMIEYDSSFSYVNIKDAMDFFELEEAVNTIEVKLVDAFRAEEVSVSISEVLGFPFFTRSWEDANRNLFKALKLERLALAIILGLIILVAALNIIGTLIMLVMEKSRDIAVLRAMGTTKEQIRRIFIIDGTIIGAIGTLIGTLLGFLFCYFLKTNEVIRNLIPFDNQIYPISEFPVKINVLYFILVAACSFLICLVATLYPSYKASEKDPVEVLRYE